MSEDRRQIVVIEDNEADADLIREAIATSGLNCEVTRFRDGVEATAALFREDAPVPHVILLDLNMPGSDGLDVLRRIRSTPRLTYTNVGILTGSQSPNDEFRASMIGATRYVHKSTSYDDYVRDVRQAVADMLQQARNP